MGHAEPWQLLCQDTHQGAVGEPAAVAHWLTPSLGPSQTHNLWLITCIRFHFCLTFFLVKCTHYCTSQKFMRVCSVLPWHHAWSWKWGERSWGLSSILPLASSIDASTAYVHKRHSVSKKKASRFGDAVTVSLHLGTHTVLMGLGAEHQPGTAHAGHS